MHQKNHTIKKSHNKKIQSNEVNNEISKERYISPKEKKKNY